MTIRIIPRLDIKGPNLVKGIRLEGLRVLGKPFDFARHYYKNGADELFYMDVVASLYGRNSLFSLVEKTAEQVFIPLTVGGGIRSLKDIEKVLSVGADKVALNTAATQQPEIVRQAAERFGSSTIAISIEAIRQNDGKYLAFTDSGREPTGRNVVDWAKEVADLGAGEIILTSVDRDGTGKGYDLELTKQVATAVSIPVIASGGAGKAEDVRDVVNQAGADAVSVASLIHYDYLEQTRTLNRDYSQEGNTRFLQTTKRNYSRISPSTLKQVKEQLIESGIECRFNQANTAPLSS